MKINGPVIKISKRLRQYNDKKYNELNEYIRNKKR